MELEIENTEVVSANNVQVEIPNAVEVSEGKKDYEVSVVKKEYTIIGDGIFIPSMYEDAPPWLKEFIDTTIEVAVTNRDQSLIDRLQSILTLMDYVPKNQYTEQINQIVSEDGIINSRIATLNSNFTDAINTTNATVAEINLTYASKDEAAAIAINALTASLSSDGEIGSALIQLQEAYADLESTAAQSINALESVMEGEINGNAAAMETIRTYVGIDEAGASTSTGLSGYLEASDGTIGGADSQLANDVRVTAEGVESKFAYNSLVNINGIYKKSGFGLSTNYTSGDGTEADPYVSEFWIDASRFKFTNSNQTGQVAPFTIDADGDTPQISFNGIVDFTNTNIASGYPGTVRINGGLLEANTVTSNHINTIGLIAENISADEIIGKTFTGGVINGARINGAVIKASYLDLDGELEVLTNYHITVAMYNANPSLYTDSVYISADNEYRIPSLSVIREETRNQTISYTGATFDSKIRSYNCANVGHNLKCVKIRPNIFVSSAVTILSFYIDTQLHGLDNSVVNGNSDSFLIYIGGTYVGSVYVYFNQWSNFEENTGTVGATIANYQNIGLPINAGVGVRRTGTSLPYAYDRVTCSVSIPSGEYSLNANFNNAGYPLIRVVNGGGRNFYVSGSGNVSAGGATASINNNILVNNMM